MSRISRIVPYVESVDFEATKAFYVDVLGVAGAMDDPDGYGFLGLTSPANRSAQIVFAAPGVDQPLPRFGIDVGHATEVDAIHAEAVRRRLRVVYPLTDEPWGIRRFFVEDPDGTVLSLLAHLEVPNTGSPATGCT